MTSEGVFVFLQEALRDAGIDAKSGQKFTVKITGVRDDKSYLSVAARTSYDGDGYRESISDTITAT